MEGPLLVLRVLLSLVCVVGIIWYAGRRLGGQTRTRRTSHEPSVRLVGRQTIGRHNGVAVVAVGTRRLLVGYGDTQVTMLAELDEVAEPEPVEDEAGTTATTPQRPSSVRALLLPGVPTQRRSPEDGAPTAAPSRPGDVPAEALASAVSPLHGSVIAPSTWRQAWHAMQERTVRR